MKKVYYPYKFSRATWSIVIVLSNIAKHLGVFRSCARDKGGSSVSGELSLLGQLFCRYDVLHVHSPTPYSYYTCLIARVLGKKIVFTGATVPETGAFFFKRYRRCVRLAHRVYAISGVVGDNIAKNCRVDVDGIIPNGVDYGFFDSELCGSAEGVPESYFITVGNINEQKNSMFVLDLAEALPDEEFVFIGGVSAGMEGFEERAGCLANVHVMGRRSREEVRDFIAGAKAMIFPANASEGFGLVVLEALALGRAVIAQPIPAMLEVLDGFSGCSMIPISECAEWVECLGAVRGEYDGSLRERVIEKYDWKRIAAEYEEIYFDLLL